MNNLVHFQKRDGWGAANVSGVAQTAIMFMPDLVQAEEFLKLLGQGQDKFTFQTLSDQGANAKNLTYQFNDDLGMVGDQLVDLNKRGAGIFVTVNETDLAGRRKENIVHIRAVFADFDDGVPDKLPLEPSIKVATSPGKYQYYWLCEDLSGDDFCSIMDRLVRDFRADPGAKDLARVLRVPGFYHHKRDPVMVQLIGGNQRVYTKEVLLKAFPPVPQRQAQREAVFDTTKITDALACIPASDYNTWIQVGLALHHEFSGSDKGYDLWESWSKGAPEKFSVSECLRKWSSFGDDCATPLTIAAVYKLARAHGWDGRRDGIQWPDIGSQGLPIRRSQLNIEAALKHFSVTVWYDTFLSAYLKKDPQGTAQLDDNVMRELYLRVDKLGCKAPKDFLVDVVCNLAWSNSKNCCIEYLDGLHWDGKPRLERLFTDYCDAEDTDFNRAVAEKFMVAAVRRARYPGTKFDNLVVLEGDQGIGKSTFGKILAGEAWFTDCVRLGDESKVIAEQTAGKWIVEIPELVGASRKDTEQIKSMLSRQQDIARMAYARSTSHFPRHFVFIGTTNATEYLIDPTGNRRFWPVKIEKVDFESLIRDRDQLWAEAVVRERNNVSLQLPPELLESTLAAQDKRRLVDPIEQNLREMLQDVRGVIPQEELFAAIGVDNSRISQRAYRHSEIIRRVMEDLLWQKVRLRKPSNMNDSYSRLDNRVMAYQRLNVGECTGAWLVYDLNEHRFVGM